MQFSIFDHLDRRNEPLQKTYGERIEFVLAAEAGGFRGYHLAEHHGTPLGMAPSPGVFLSAVARATSTIRLGPLVYLLPLYTPLRLIEEICMLDHLSGGRLDVGVGRGVSPIEVGFYGYRPEQTAAIYAEALEVIIEGLTRKRLNFHGSHYHYDDVPMENSPSQSPLPFWSASMSPDGQALAAQWGMHNIALGTTQQIKQAADNYRRVWGEQKDHPRRSVTAVDNPFIGAYRLVVVGKDDHHAESLARPAFKDWFDKLAKLWREHHINPPLLGPLVDYDIARRHGMLVVGSPNHVLDQLSAQVEHCGINYLALQIAFGNLTHAEEMASLERFSSQVISQFR